MVTRGAKSHMIFTLLIALIAILLLVGGQTLLKVGLNDIGGVSLFDGDPLGSLLRLFRTPWIILGFACYGVSAVLWLDVLSKLDFSMAFPMVSLTYVFSLVIGRLIFHETVGLDRILGVLLILSGLFFVVRSGR
ncbi:MAG: EamA family transporter [Anaerolineales bacterium]|nr:MAG: EamA family transporter [Anaerolineales bacterium]